MKILADFQICISVTLKDVLHYATVLTHQYYTMRTQLKVLIKFLAVTSKKIQGLVLTQWKKTILKKQQY